MITEEMQIAKYLKKLDELKLQSQLTCLNEECKHAKVFHDPEYGCCFSEVDEEEFSMVMVAASCTCKSFQDYESYYYAGG